MYIFTIAKATTARTLRSFLVGGMLIRTAAASVAAIKPVYSVCAIQR